MKRIISIIIALLSFFPLGIGITFAGDCTQQGEEVSDCLNSKESQMKDYGAITLDNYGIEDGVRQKVVAIANRIITITSLISVGAIVFAGFWMVTAYGDDERVKKGKNSLKWGIGGLLVSLLSFAIVNAIVNLFYSVGG